MTLPFTWSYIAAADALGRWKSPMVEHRNSCAIPQHASGPPSEAGSSALAQPQIGNIPIPASGFGTADSAEANPSLSCLLFRFGLRLRITLRRTLRSSAKAAEGLARHQSSSLPFETTLLSG